MRKQIIILLGVLLFLSQCRYNIISPPDILNKSITSEGGVSGNLNEYLFDDFENEKSILRIYLGYGNMIPKVTYNIDKKYVKSGKSSLCLEYKIANGSWGVGLRRDFKIEPIDLSGIRKISLWIYPDMASPGRYFLLQLKSNNHSWKSKLIPLLNKNWQKVTILIDESPDGLHPDGNYSLKEDLKNITSIRFRIDNNRTATPREKVYFDKVIFIGTRFNSDLLVDKYKVDKNVYINNFREVEPDLKYGRGLWVWKTSMIFEKGVDEFFKFCKKKRVNLIFLYTGMQKGAYIIEKFNKELKEFNKKAHSMGISVHSLDGDPKWTYTENHSEALDRAMDVINFNKKALKEERFDGVHHDVEPHGLQEVKKLKKRDDYASKMLIEKIYKQYIELCRKTQELIDKYKNTQNIEFGIDIPFWYKQPTKVRTVTINGVKKAISDYLTDIVDNIGIMDYKDNGDGMIRFAMDEIEYADKIPGKKIYIGANVNDSKLEITSFWQEGEVFMERELDKVDKAFVTHPSYRGLAIHSFKTYKVLRP